MPDRENELAQRQKIVEAAIDLYVDDRANFTTSNLAKKTRIKKGGDPPSLSFAWRDIKVFLSSVRHALQDDGC